MKSNTKRLHKSAIYVSNISMTVRTTRLSSSPCANNAWVSVARQSGCTMRKYYMRRRTCDTSSHYDNLPTRPSQHLHNSICRPLFAILFGHRRVTSSTSPVLYVCGLYRSDDKPILLPFCGNFKIICRIGVVIYYESYK